MAVAADPPAPGARPAAIAAGRLRPVPLALLLAAAALLLHGLGFGLTAPLGQLPQLGTAVTAAGLSWALWAAWTLHQAGTPLRTGSLPLVLVEEGPYRWGRNPMLLGLVTGQLGVALALGVPALVGTAVAFGAIVARWHVPAEEARLRQRFGGWYSDYTAQVRRWG